MEEIVIEKWWRKHVVKVVEGFGVAVVYEVHGGQSVMDQVLLLLYSAKYSIGNSTDSYHKVPYRL